MKYIDIVFQFYRHNEGAPFSYDGNNWCKILDTSSATHIKVVKIDRLVPLSSPQRAILKECMFSTRISEILGGHILA